MFKRMFDQLEHKTGVLIRGADITVRIDMDKFICGPANYIHRALNLRLTLTEDIMTNYHVESISVKGFLNYNKLTTSCVTVGFGEVSCEVISEDDLLKFLLNHHYLINPHNKRIRIPDCELGFILKGGENISLMELRQLDKHTSLQRYRREQYYYSPYYPSSNIARTYLLTKIKNVLQRRTLVDIVYFDSHRAVNQFFNIDELTELGSIIQSGKSMNTKKVKKFVDFVLRNKNRLLGSNHCL